MRAVKQKGSGRRVKRTANYLTKRIVGRAARQGLTEAAEQTMKVMGFTVIAHDGWVVKKHTDGRLEKITKLNSVNRTLALD